jgi:hypothetical protein
MGLGTAMNVVTVLAGGAEAIGGDASYCRFATSREHADRRALKKAPRFSGWQA